MRLLADDRGDRRFAVAECLEIGDCLASHRRPCRQQCLAGVVLDREALLRRRLAAPVARQQAPADAEERDGDAGQRQADRREVEQADMAGRLTSWRTCDIRTLGEVPIWVIVPPISEPKASGIR